MPASLKVRLTISLQDEVTRELVTMFPASKIKKNDKNEVQYSLRISLTIYLNTPALFLQLVDERNAEDDIEVFSTEPGTKACDNTSKARIKTVPGKDYIMLPLWTADPPFSQSLKSSQDDGSEPSSDDKKKVDEDPRKDSESIDQEKDDN
ncbi:hypothetical protein Tco_1238892, partial [Tanacetum coccineum]